MREILFRGKTNNGEWVEGYYYIGKLSGFPMIYENKKDGTKKAVLPETVGQYTGLTKNGKKIFEGDIVRVDTREMTGVVDFSSACWCVRYKFDRVSWDFLGNLVQKYQLDCPVEVVGNIYDNPELLEVEE